MRLDRILVILAIAVIVLAGTSSYSAYVASQNHRNSCNSRTVVLDAVHDVLQIFLTPQPGQRFTATQVQRITGLETAAYARINQARC